MTVPTYARPASSHFAHRVVRAMTKSCAAHQIGMDGFALVALIAHQWDTVRYARPVTYRIAHLMNLAGIGSVQTFYRIERKCIAAGWLQKHSLGARQAPAYWVTIPGHASELPDTVTDDHDDIDGNENGSQTGMKTGMKTGIETVVKRELKQQSNGNRNGNPSSLSQDPIPLPGERAPVEIDPDPLGTIPLAQSPTAPPPRNDEDLWRFEVAAMSWARALVKVGAKLGSRNWRPWMALVDQYGIDAVTAAAKGVPAEERWPDRTETALGKSRGQLPIAEALAVSGRKAVIL